MTKITCDFCGTDRYKVQHVTITPFGEHDRQLKWDACPNCVEIVGDALRQLASDKESILGIIELREAKRKIDWELSKQDMADLLQRLEGGRETTKV